MTDEVQKSLEDKEVGNATLNNKDKQIVESIDQLKKVLKRVKFSIMHEIDIDEITEVEKEGVIEEV